MSGPSGPSDVSPSLSAALATRPDERQRFREGEALQDLALAASLETQFREPYKHGEYTNKKAFWLGVQRGRGRGGVQRGRGRGVGVAHPWRGFCQACFVFF